MQGVINAFVAGISFSCAWLLVHPLDAANAFAAFNIGAGVVNGLLAIPGRDL